MEKKINKRQTKKLKNIIKNIKIFKQDAPINNKKTKLKLQKNIKFPNP